MWTGSAIDQGWRCIRGGIAPASLKRVLMPLDFLREVGIPGGAAVVIAVASFLCIYRFHIFAPKRDVLRRLLGSRYLLTDAMVYPRCMARN